MNWGRHVKTNVGGISSLRSGRNRPPAMVVAASLLFLDDVVKMRDGVSCQYFIGDEQSLGMMQVPGRLGSGTSQAQGRRTRKYRTGHKTERGAAWWERGGRLSPA